MRRLWLRIFIGLAVVLVLALGGTALGYYLWFNAKVSAANARVPEGVADLLRSDSGGRSDATDILLIGSDSRDESEWGYQSDVVMIVHVDKANDYMSTLSIPRDLRVEVEGHGMHKINWTYAAGGPALLIDTVQKVTGLDLDHYFQVDLKAFMDMTDSIGGVYMEIDRYYTGVDFNHETKGRVEGVIEPGYQLLDGRTALGYVRFRFDESQSYGRMARHERFLSALKQQAMGWGDIGGRLTGLAGGLLDNAATDMGTNQMIGLARWGIGIDGQRTRQVVLQGEGQMIGDLKYYISSDEDIDEAVEALITPPAASSASAQPVSWAAQRPTLAAATVGGLTPRMVGIGTLARESAEPGPAKIALSSGSFSYRDEKTVKDPTAWSTAANNVSFAVEAPTYVAADFKLAPKSGTYAYIYDIAVGSTGMPTLVMLYGHTGTGYRGNISLKEEFINVTATTWVDAPAASKGREIEHDGAIFTVVRNADGVERIWWKRNGMLYWVSNSLNRVASQDELLMMAQSMVSLSGE